MRARILCGDQIYPRKSYLEVTIVIALARVGIRGLIRHWLDRLDLHATQDMKIDYYIWSDQYGAFVFLLRASSEELVRWKLTLT